MFLGISHIVWPESELFSLHHPPPSSSPKWSFPFSTWFSGVKASFALLSCLLPSMFTSHSNSFLDEASPCCLLPTHTSSYVSIPTVWWCLLLFLLAHLSHIWQLELSVKMMNLATVSIPQTFDGHPLSTKTNLSVLVWHSDFHITCQVTCCLFYPTCTLSLLMCMLEVYPEQCGC